ncbi:protein-disulfide reductase DsbD family protein [Mangrovivirga sp. M17]|uniref:Protein-disulfide reductase DsbD family protein n=1 Tax=Mangrovivirga halotolerans TaxID=2993936 RepID=A0ABT3RU39_9BACT|nr:cytochrome c biogenesis protein CcdA [Mangrovivirga halotolerans]MCX2744868.1 protein-disulfide reductase DsbD family protein [Mangrovivirga halotolerans]
MKNIAIAFALILLISVSATAQIIQPAKWNVSIDNNNVKVGETVTLKFTANIDAGWYLYSSDFDPDCGPVVATVSLNNSESYEPVGPLKAIDPKSKMDEIFGCEVKYFKGTGSFEQAVKITSTTESITGSIDGQVCSDETGQCILVTEDFNLSVNVSGGSSEKAKIDSNNHQKEAETSKSSSINKDTIDESQAQKYDITQPVNEENISIDQSFIVGERKGLYVKDFPSFFTKDVKPEEENKGLLLFMVVAFLSGLVALLTPCVFPMIPMTVSFFTGKGSKSKAIRDALIYGISIVAIYTVIGAALSPFMGPETANHLATEWLPNVIFFLVFLIFAISFFGAFDIVLPSNLVNVMDKKADKGGFLGPFFMAFTLALVSFSCTGPIVGSLLVESAGEIGIKPIAGMFAFGLAFAIPFTLFAIFPNWLSSLPKSGGWLNSVKVVLGFIELALAFKFLSVADQAFHWGILDREIYLGIWIVIFTLMGFYLLGKIRLPHDSPMDKIGVGRFLFSIITFWFVIYLIPGMFGAPLKALAGYLPPMHTHDFNLVGMIKGEEDTGPDANVKYSEFLHLPHGLDGYFDYGQALAAARRENKPIFIDFTGHGCTNCREMEAVVWSDPRVQERLKEDYIILALYVDDKTELDKEEWYISAFDDKVKKTLGKQNADIQIQRANNNAQPNYILLDTDQHALVPPVGYDKDVDNFIDFLDRGKEAFYEKN